MDNLCVNYAFLCVAINADNISFKFIIPITDNYWLELKACIFGDGFLAGYSEYKTSYHSMILFLLFVCLFGWVCFISFLKGVAFGRYIFI